MLKLATLKCFCLKKKKILYLAILPLRRSVLWRTVFCVFAEKQPDTRPPTYLKVKAALPPDSRVRATFFFAAKLHFGERWIWTFISFSGKREVTACIHGASRAARAACISSVHRSLSGQSRGVDVAVEDEVKREVHGTEAVVSFSLKCLKVGMDRWWGPSECPPNGHARQRASGPALHAGQESLPRGGAVRLQNPMCFLPRRGPLPGAAGPHPGTPRPHPHRRI